MKYKLKTNLYYDDDGDVVLPYRWDEYSHLLARKGQIAERVELTDELREEHGVYDTMWKYIWLFQKGCSYLLTQESDCEHFEEIK